MLERLKKNARKLDAKKVGKDKYPVVKLLDTANRNRKQSDSFNGDADGDDSDNQEYGVKKKKKLKKCCTKRQKKNIASNNTTSDFSNSHNVHVKLESLDFSQGVVKIPRLEPNDIDALTVGFSESGPTASTSAEGGRSNIVSEFYQKCSQLTKSQESSDDAGSDERNLSFLEQLHSNSKGASPSKTKEKKYRHKNCHKSKKHRSDGSKLRDLLKGGLPESAESMSVYNNALTSNDSFRVSSINDVFVSSITPEFVVELETTPLEQLCRHDQLTITKVEVPEKPTRMFEPSHPDVTVKVKSETDVADTSIRALREQIMGETVPSGVQVLTSQPSCRNYLSSAVSIVDANTRSSFDVPSSSNYVSFNKVKSDGSLLVAKPRIEEPKINIFNPAYNVVVKTENTPAKTISKAMCSQSPTKKKLSIKDATDYIDNMERERDLNAFCSRKEPYCCLCSIFSTRPEDNTLIVNWRSDLVSRVEPPTRGDAVFYSKFRHGNLTEANLLKCSVCELRVHDLCYGAKTIGSQSLWECDLCREHEERKTCMLCPVRCGPIKKLQDGNWVHILCNIFVSASNPCNQSTVDVTYKLKKSCSICGSENGSCIPCNSYKCKKWVHATCAVFAGFTFELVQTKFVIYCCAHRSQKKDCVGNITWAKRNNGRYYKCRVLNENKSSFLAIEFPDGSRKCDVTVDELSKANPGKTWNVDDVVEFPGMESGKLMGCIEKVVSCVVAFDNGEEVVVPMSDICRDLENVIPQIGS